MRRMLRNILAGLLALALALVTPGLVQSARGVPGSPEFGFGAVFYPDGPLQKQALDIAGELALDWIAVPVSWAAYQPDSARPMRFDRLDTIMQFSAQRKIAVLVSITNIPAWAQTSHGPDPAQAASFVRALLERYPDAIQAVELFPGANTLQGWGAQPDAQAYLNLYQTVRSQLSGAGQDVLLVAAGLRQLAGDPGKGNISDMEFLRALYAAGASSLLPVISIQYSDLTGDTASFPTANEHRVLRHYEEIRQIMTENHHQTGVIWVTRFGPPSGTISTSDSVYQELNTQSTWMNQAYCQLRAQLYIGVTIGQSLNPVPEGADAEVPSLLRGGGKVHPFYSVLDEMISLNRVGSVTIKPGKPKEGNFTKKRQ